MCGCRRLTDAAALQEGAAAYSVDLSEATKLQEEDFLSRTKERIVAWLQRDHLGLIGWAWLGMGLTVAMLLCCLCCACGFPEHRHPAACESCGDSDGGG